MLSAAADAQVIAESTTETAPLRGGAAQRYVESHHPYTWDELLAFPKYLEIETVNTCNARCTICGIDFDRRTPRRMPDDLFDKIVAELAEHRSDVARASLVLNSEPLMDRHLAEKVAKLKQAGIQTMINTNASLLSRVRAEELLHAGLDLVYISIDSLDPARFESIRRGLSFAQVYSNTLEFIRLKRAIHPASRLRITMVQIDDNAEEADAFVKHWMQLLGPTDEVVVTRGYNWGIAQSVVARHGASLDEHNRVPCIGLWSSFAIDVHGEVRMCCADQEGKTLLGDLRQQSIAEIWHGEELAKVRATHLGGRRTEIAMCDGCPIWSTGKHVRKHEMAAAATAGAGGIS